MITKHQIKYTGPTQHTRVLTHKDGEGVGVVFPKDDMVWSLDNHHTLLLDELDDTAVDWFKTGPHADEFKVKVVEIAEEGDEPPAAKPSKAEAVDAEVLTGAEGSQDGGGGLGDTGTGPTGSATTSTTGTGRGGRASTA